ncbi:pyridoxal 5'-phosphate synthase glutaminase subunit PdxT [Bifidobacterium gallicum]|uniref:Pyridoxal 5'-phosphate synthase subunit PdxT n=1 Tax=Bifidobacterium gallicum DSM 20093 = LMG 11596 TaxID=561180 RepID=D1NWM4_9BIFI|nr:pyridoxal 5'-phosphate synthase glutaminase subunit PdxT [Bifidobacterium gallicum]EFA22183.1 pyridoxal 5'-phosphate synthase, glutaminase subunit Pdx2 [Bifidobacterium gallicum DSM 20093 = LMG 11596]KFI59078.1 glutamine amidotransferase [Bifidobacterium gallicum DSM 20093 = LMG 11596]
MVVDVSYISKETSDHLEDVMLGAPSVTGIVAVQGAFAEHAAMLDRLGVPWKLLRNGEDFDDSIARVILPGGESTTQGKLLHQTGLYEPIAAHIAAGRPVFGTCAGMILLARELEDDPTVHFGAMDVTVRRNAYGRQLGSFSADADIDFSVDVADGDLGEEVTGDAAEADYVACEVNPRIDDYPVVFIRGPLVSNVGEEANVAAMVNGQVVAVRQGNLIATAFHPELTDDTRIHEFFLSL